MGMLRFTLVLALLAGLAGGSAGCDKPAEQDTAGQPGADSADAGAQPDAVLAPDTAASGDAVAGPTGGGDAVSVAGDAATAYFDEIDVNFSFFRADFNANPDANLSLLRFAFDARVTRSAEVNAEVVLSDRDQVAKAELDLHHAKLEVYPIAARPQQFGEGAQGEFGIRFDGMYQLRVLLPGGELAGLFAVGEDGELLTAPPDEQPTAYLVRSRHRADDYGPRKYQVFRRVGSGQEAAPLFSIAFDRGGFQTHKVVDPDGNVYEYRFPEGRLTLGFGASAEGEAPAKRRDPNKERKDD